MKKRLLASLMSLCLIVGLLPTAAFAAEDPPAGQDEQPTVCTCEAPCTEESRDEACPVCVEDYTLCTYEEPPTTEKQPASEPVEDVPAELENDQPNQFNENNISVLTDVSFPLTGYCGADSTQNSQEYNCVSGNNSFTGTYYSNATWTITENGVLGDDDSKAAYKLTISGTGAIGDFGTSWSYGRPWHYALADAGNFEVTESKNRITEIEIADGITEIGAHTFEAYENVTSITLPNSVVKIGENAFNSCKGATTITWGNGLKEIGATAFSDCDALTSLSLPNGLEVIGASAFSSCDALTGNLVIPDSVTAIGDSVFANDSSLNGTLTIGSSVQTIGNSAFGGCKFTGSLTIPDSVTSVGDGVFNACEFSSISLGNGLVEIGENAFYNSGTYSGHLSIPDSVTTIGENAFTATGFSSIHLGKSVTNIGASAFINCTAVHSLDIASVSSPINYGTSAFNSMANPNILYVNSESQKSEISNYITLGSSAFAITNGGTFAEDTEFTSGALATPIKDGSIFAGWYANSNFTGEAVTSTTAGQTYYARWIDLSDLTAADIQYGGTASMPNLEGVTFSNWQSKDSSIVFVEDNQLKANKVGATVLTADATTTAGGSAKATFSIEVTPRVLSFTYKEAGSGSITYDYTGDAPALSTHMTFAWKDEPKTTVTLDEGTQVNYTYTIDTASGGSGSPETYDELPTNVGQYSVTLNLIDPNYTFNLTGGDSGTSNTLSITVNVEAEGKTRAYLASAAPKGEVFTYNGTGIMPVEGVLQAYAEDSTTSATVDIGQFTISIRGMNDTVFEESSVTVDAGTDLSSLTGLTLPVKPGQYQITASASNDSYYLYKTLVFAIDKATVTIKANDKTAYVGDEVPALGAEDYTVTGLVGNDTLTTAPNLSYEGTPDMSTTGTYTIKASGAAANDELYKLVYEDGTLTVSRRSSGGGGGSSSGSTGNVTGSGDDVNIDVSGGTVTAAQMEKAVDKADRGETITIEASSRSSVSLPSSGLQDAADNNNDVTVELKNGEVTLSPEALSAVAEQAGTTVTLTVDPVDTDELNSRQQAAVGDAPVFDLTIKSGGKTITDFDGGLVTVAIPYELPDGQDPAGVVVWFMDDNGNITACETMYDLRTETVIFTTRHFSKYVIGYEEPMNFTDVPADAYYSDAVKWAVAEGITKGTSDTTFGPDVSCTRAQMVTFLWRAAGSPKATGSNPFTDVQAGSYYYDAVLWAVEQGITSGTSATTFAPDDTVTRAQTVTFLWRQAGAPVVNYAMSFTDVDANAYYGEAVRWAVSEGITSGTSDSTFSPDMDCTRAQIVTFLYRDAQ